MSQTETQVSSSVTPSVSPTGRVVVFELDTDNRRTASRHELNREPVIQKYKFGIKKWQRYVDVNIPVDGERKEASAHVAKVPIPTHAWVGRIFGDYTEMLVVSAA